MSTVTYAASRKPPVPELGVRTQFPLTISKNCDLTTIILTIILRGCQVIRAAGDRTMHRCALRATHTAHRWLYPRR